MPARGTFEPFGTYVLLEDGGDALPVEVTPMFWPELISGERRSEGATKIAAGHGWLMCALPKKDDPPTWEMHPAGDEILYMLSGALDVVLEQPDGEQVIALRAGTACVVPRGVWHRTVVRVPGDMLAITYGKGTQHRPI
jgi:mannose-6-phosphate isomerase-like protein (cupin superfamily)